MARYTVKRVTADPDGHVVATCTALQVGYQYIVHDNTTGEDHVENMCIAKTNTDPCVPLLILTDRGYADNDWAEECGLG